MIYTLETLRAMKRGMHSDEQLTVVVAPPAHAPFRGYVVGIGSRLSVRDPDHKRLVEDVPAHWVKYAEVC
ncbi:hypothetical protein [Streptomyces sp. NPDC046805]|uniref:hypothetical protein n=1 Tax=Streptomyces sp. NPDC046805 TaxID=3155134 RepID=UPI0034063376